MRTLHSIDLKYIHDKCFAETFDGRCRVYSIRGADCRTHKCKFYKPDECKEWIRVEDRHGVNLVPPEEYEKVRRKK